MISNQPNVYSVAGLTAYLRRLIEGDVYMQDVWVEGELSNLSHPASGHLYFTIKDEASQLRAVMWRSDAARLRTALQHGEKVRAHGRIGVTASYRWPPSAICTPNSASAGIAWRPKGCSARRSNARCPPSRAGSG
jgi:hypothetical protein